MTVKCKTFDLYIKEAITYPRRAPKWFSDNRLTTLEKKILQGYLSIRVNQSKQVIEELKDCHPSDIDFVQDHWNMILGICYNNIGEHALAEKHLQKAMKAFRASSSSYHLFTSLFNYFLLLSNLGRVAEMGDVLHEMESLSPPETLAQNRIIRCRFIYALDANDSALAYKLIKEIEKKIDRFSESDRAQHLVCAFMFYIKEEAFAKAEKVLDDLKKCRNYSISENYIFMKRLLSHLVDGDPIYVYEREFPTTTFLFYQMKVIESLQSQNQSEAKNYWSKLQALYPALYQDNFCYQGEKSLFSLCLKKEIGEEKIEVKVFEGEAPLHQKLFYILKEAKAPLSNGLIFELLWGEAPETKDDYVRLARLVSKVRIIYKTEVISKKGTYFISKEESSEKKTS